MPSKNTKITETLNLPDLSEILGDIPGSDTFPQSEENETEENIEEVAEDVTEKNQSMMSTPRINEIAIDDHGSSMDEIHKETIQTARDLVDLGFNADQRSAASIFEKANMFYETVLKSKSDKRDKQLRTMKLLLEQRKLDLEERKFQHEIGENVIQGDATILKDRNELIKKMREDKEPK